ncbi:hypothetical protein BaRGS_00007424 [Batillaria attramentaria]|uniref:Uncharacterized protein n=1 Tax=Batillaria attramentaria TaxID=370345 RepID=A0ABD0LP94_9CAEN
MFVSNANLKKRQLQLQHSTVSPFSKTPAFLPLYHYDDIYPVPSNVPEQRKSAETLLVYSSKMRLSHYFFFSDTPGFLPCVTMRIASPL